MPLARWIWSVNGERRHLTIDQITAAQVAIKAWEEQEAARQRQIDAGKQFHKGRRKVVTGRSQPLPEAAGRVREKLAQEIGVSQRKVGQALAIQKADPELLKQVAQGKLALREAASQVKGTPGSLAQAPPGELPPASASAPENTSKRRQMIENAAKRRMIDGLSHIQGACRGLSRLDLSAVLNACTEEETRTWAVIARNAARELRAVASKLLAALGEKE